MSNMSYCRFENTLHDLADCLGAMEELIEGDEAALSGTELQCAEQLVEMCFEFVTKVCEATEREVPVSLEDLRLREAVREINENTRRKYEERMQAELDE